MRAAWCVVIGYHHDRGTLHMYVANPTQKYRGLRSFHPHPPKKRRRKSGRHPCVLEAFEGVASLEKPSLQLGKKIGAKLARKKCHLQQSLAVRGDQNSVRSLYIKIKNEGKNYILEEHGSY